MRAPLIRGALAVAFVFLGVAAHAGTPVTLAERQVTTLEFSQPIARVAVTDPDLVGLRAQGARLTVTAQRGGRSTVEVTFEDGATITLDVTVEPARRAAARPSAPDEIEVRLGEERRIPAPGVARVLVEENGVARARVEGHAVFVTGVAPGSAAVVVVDASGRRITWTVRVR